MVGARLADPLVGVVVDQGHPLRRRDGRNLGGPSAIDKEVADENVVNQFQPAAVQTCKTLGFGVANGSRWTRRPNH